MFYVRAPPYLRGGVHGRAQLRLQSVALGLRVHEAAVRQGQLDKR